MISMKIRGRDKKSSVFLICFGALIVVTAYQFGLGSLTQPGPGFIPFGGGLFMILSSVVVYLQARTQGAESERSFVRIGNRKIVLFTILLIPFILSFRTLGFILSNFLLLAFLFELMERKSWFASALVSVVSTGIGYLVFAVWLKVQLPKGFIGF